MATLTKKDSLEAIEDYLRITKEERRKEAEAVARIMYKKFGTTDLEELRAIIINRRVGLVYDNNNLLIGVSINRRWLYTLNGQIIGKKGKRWMFENIKYDTTH